MAELTGKSPRLSAKPTAYGDSQKLIDAYDLHPFVPTYEVLDEVNRVLDPAATLPSVKEVSFSDPEVVALYFQSYGGAEPALAFEGFLKGVVAASFIVDPSQRHALSFAVEGLAAAVMQGAGIPSVGEEFEERVRHCVEAVFSNNEPTSWRNLLAFTIGAFWALGFLKRPFEKVENEIAPVTWVQALVERYAQLGHLPQ